MNRNNPTAKSVLARIGLLDPTIEKAFVIGHL